MLSSGATLKFPPPVRPWFTAPLVLPPPLCAVISSGSSISSEYAASSSASYTPGVLKSAMLKLTRIVSSS